MALDTVIIPLDPETFEYQNYDISDERLIAQSDLDTAFTASTDYIEYYIYDQNQTLIYPSITVPLEDYDIREGDVLLNPSNNLSDLGFDIGTYSISYNFYRKRLSSSTTDKYFIVDISSDRTEIRLDSNIIENALIISSSNTFSEYRENTEYFVDFYLNFGENQTVIANNLKLETEEGVDPTVLVKLYEPLPSNFNIKDELWVVEILSTPQSYEVTFPFEPIVEDDFTYLAGPNYSLNVTQQTGASGEQFSYNTLLNSDITSSVNQVKSLLNEKEVDININYENYGNFVNFSSAKTRLENFYYKVGLIESSSNILETFLGQVTSQTRGSVSFSSSIATLTSQIDNVIENFDGYEYFLYFNSGSLYDYPKSNNTPPFQLYSTGSVEVLTWIGSADPDSGYYGGQALSASDYDQNNRDWLYWSIPEYLRNDSENLKYELFLDMVGQYYDNVWVYTKDITNKFNADNRLDYGISKDLVADAIRDFSVKLYSNNFNTDDLFTAFLGLTPSGSSFPFPNITGSVVDGDGGLDIPSGYEYVDTKISASNDIVPLDDVNKSIYKRIYHNIPYLLKTKGTIAGIRALITSYGIPDTILRISEFGGKDRNEAQDYDLKQDVFNYAFDTGRFSTNHLQSSLQANPKFQPQSGTNSARTIQLRFKSAPLPLPIDNVANGGIRYSQSLWSTDDGGNLVLEYNGAGFVSGSYSGSVSSPYDAYGTLKFIPAQQDNPANSSSVYLPFFNGDWWSVQINTSTDNSSLYAANEMDGKIGFNESSSTTGFDDSYYFDASTGYLNKDTDIVFDDDTTYTPFSGSFQELRYWVQEISQSNFYDYTVNPYSNEGNGINSTPNQQFFRAPLGTQLDTGSRKSIHPKVAGSTVQITQSFANDSIFYYNRTTGNPFVVNVEDIFQDQVPAGMKNRITEKVHLRDTIIAEAPYGYTPLLTSQFPESEGLLLPTQGKITASALSPMISVQQQLKVSQSKNIDSVQSYTPNVDYLEVAFSPSNQINDDINAQLGYFNLGDYIGDPRFISSSDNSYPDLDRLRDEYFEKYISNYNVVDFVRLIKFFDNSLFKMIKDFTPARTSLASGVVVKQHILERNRQRPAQVTSSNATLEGLVSNLPKDYNSNSLVKHTALIEADVLVGYGVITSTEAGVSRYPVTTNGRGKGAFLEISSDGVNIDKVSVFTIGSDYVVGDTITVSKTIIDESLTLGIVSGDVVITLLVPNIQTITTTNLLDYPQYSTSGSSIYKFSAGAGGVMNRYNGMQSAPPSPSNQFYLTQSYDVTGTAREPYAYSEINSTYFNYSSSQFLSASYQGSGSTTVSSQHEFYDGEFSGSNIVLSDGIFNRGCGPYLSVPDVGALFDPIFFNNFISLTQGGSVTQAVFNNPDNEPKQGDAWVFSQYITDPQVRLLTGAVPDINYVTSIKLSRLDKNGNDVTDYIEQGQIIQLTLPDSDIFGGGICSYVVAGVIPESNSVRLTVKLQQESNRYWSPQSSQGATFNFRIASPGNLPIPGQWIDDQNNPQTRTSLTISETSINGTNFREILQSLVDNIQPLIGKLIEEYIVNGVTYTNIYDINSATEPSATVFTLQVLLNVDSPQNNPPETDPQLTTLTIISFSGGIKFPITSSANGGTENWSFEIETEWTSSEARRNSSDNFQQNVFTNKNSLNQTQIISTWAPSNSEDPANPTPTQNLPTINAIEPNGYQASQPNNTSIPQYLGESIGQQGQYLEGGMLRNDGKYWDYGAYTLSRTPNVPLNFEMVIEYSGSDTSDPSGTSTVVSSGILHKFQGYQDVAGNVSQAVNLSPTGTGWSSVSAFQIAGPYQTKDQATAAQAPSSNQVYYISTITSNPPPPFNIDDAPSILRSIVSIFSNPNLSPASLANDIFFQRETTNVFFAIFDLVGNNAGVGRMNVEGEGPGVTPQASFDFIFSNRILGNPTRFFPPEISYYGEGSKSLVFRPSTSEEGVTSPSFIETFNPLVPGAAGSNKSVMFTNLNDPLLGGGHPKIAIAGTASLDYTFGDIKLAANFPIPRIINETSLFPASNIQGSSLNSNYGLVTTPSNAALYEYFIASSEDYGNVIFNSLKINNFKSLAEIDAVDNRGEIDGGDIVSWTFTPAFDFDIDVYVTDPFASTLQIEAYIEYSVDGGASFTKIEGTGYSQGPAIERLSTRTVNETINTNRVKFNINSGPLQAGDFVFSNNPTNLQFRLAFISNVNFAYSMNEWDIPNVRFQYNYRDPNLFTSPLYSINPAVFYSPGQKAVALDIEDPITDYLNEVLIPFIQNPEPTPTKIQAFLKYTGSINDGTDNCPVVDTIMASSDIVQLADLTNDQVISFAGVNGNTGTHTNVNPYNETTNPSSTLNISGGMYYLEYSMSEYVNEGQQKFVDFVIPTYGSDDTIPLIDITQTYEGGLVEIPNPTATLSPNVYFGNTNDKSVFGNLMTWDSGQTSLSPLIGQTSIGTYTFSGAFQPRVAPFTKGWNLGDTFRMGITAVKDASNIGVTVTKATLKISPASNIYAPITASVLEPNVYRVPVLTQFAIPTYYENGVLPFNLALDCQPLLNNFNDSRPSRYIMDVDYTNESGPIIPVNQEQILAGIATRATVPDSNYQTKGWVNPRYLGSRSTCRSYNIHTYGDKGTLGQTPNIEIRFAYFAYFESIANPYPLFNGVTQLNVAYIIDEQENASPPSLDGLSYEIMQSLYPPDSTPLIQINSGSNVLGELNGPQSVTSVGTRYEPICFSQNSGNNYTNTIPLSGSGLISIYDNAGTPGAKTIYGMSVMGQSVSSNDGSDLASTKSFNITIAPGYTDTNFSITRANGNTEGTDITDFKPYNTTTPGQFLFQSAIDLLSNPPTPLKNPQKVYLEQKVSTSFLYESGRAEMTLKLRCVVEKYNGVDYDDPINIPFDLQDITLETKYLGKVISLGSVLGRVENGGGWRSGQMVQFNGSTPGISDLGGGNSSKRLNSNNEMEAFFENPVLNDLLYNKGINWKNQGGIEQNGPVEYHDWTISADTGDYIFNGGDKMHWEFQGQMFGGLNVFNNVGYTGDYFPASMTVIGANDTTTGDNEASSPFWQPAIGRTSNFIQMLSPNFNEAYGPAWTQGPVPYIPGESFNFPGGYEPVGTKFPKIKKPLKFQKGDQIRFGNNEKYSYNVVNVIAPEDNIIPNANPALSGTARLVLELDRPVPSSGINLDFFLIRRPITDPSTTYIGLDFPYEEDFTLDIAKSGSVFSSGGLILPDFPSEGIALSSSQIINNLISKGVIKS